MVVRMTQATSLATPCRRSSPWWTRLTRAITTPIARWTRRRTRRRMLSLLKGLSFMRMFPTLMRR